MKEERTPDQYDLLLQRIAAEEMDEKKEKGTFLFLFQDAFDPRTGLINNSIRLLFEWAQWSRESQKAVERCADKGLLELRPLKPTEKGFQLRLFAYQQLATAPLPPENRLREDYFGRDEVGKALWLTRKGIEYLRDILTSPA